MGRRRTKDRSLTGTRIYKRRGAYWYEPKEPILNPATGKIGKFHKLCEVSAGEHAARCAVQKMLRNAASERGTGDFVPHFRKWRDQRIEHQNRLAPKDPERLKIHRNNIQGNMTWYNQIEAAFCDFDVEQISAENISDFLDQWYGRRTAQVLLSYITQFLKWCVVRRIIKSNVARDVEIADVAKRKVLITDAQFEAIRVAALASGRMLKTGKRRVDHKGKMLQIFLELSYLLAQRGTDIRLLRWDAISEEGILVTPTKTERSSGKQVQLPMTDAIKAVLDKARLLPPSGCEYVIHDRQGTPYSAFQLNDRFRQVCERLKLSGFTMKDIRAMSATDAHKAGYTDEEIKTQLAHTTTATTLDYLRERTVEKSLVRMQLPSQRGFKPPVKDAGEQK